MTLHLIVDYTENNPVLGSFINAAEKRNLDVNVVCSDDTDFFSLPNVEKGDLLYRHGLSKRATRIERLIIRDDVAHFHRDAEHAFSGRTSSYFYNKRAGLPVINTIPLLPQTESDIQQHVDYLGGFPLIVKVMGGSKGVGVMKVDSIMSLKSILDYVRSLDVMIFIRSFVPHSYYGRLIVVGDNVVASNTTHSTPDEFRTNVINDSESDDRSVVFSEEIQKVAVQAVHSMGLKFGGVDLLFTSETEYYISEVNFPCAFNHAEKHTGIDISGKMIDFLICESRLIVSA
jgi:glutathione synthase/RimK-type ligase-like ATP-grasp enzyme